MTPAGVLGVATRARLGDVVVGFTDARLDVAEAAPSRAGHLARAVASLAPGARVARMHQVHGSSIAEVGAGAQPTGAESVDHVVADVDGLVTTATDLALVVRAADCVPVVLADPVAGVVGVAHAGRPGLVAGVVPALVGRMAGHGASHLHAWIGPAVCGGCYEVPAEMAAAVADAVPQARATTRWGTPAVDIVRGVRAQLAEAGVTRVHADARCTREDPTLHSYRRDGAASGRLAGIVARRGTPS